MAVTANALKGEEQRCLTLGMDGYLTKPLDLAHLEGALKRWYVHGLEVGRARSDSSNPELKATPGDAQVQRPPVEPSVMLDTFGIEDPAMLKDFIRKFLQTRRADAIALTQALNEGNATVAGTLSHKLKSSARTIGAHPFAELCEAIEATAVDGPAQENSEMANDVTKCFDSIEDFLLNYENC